MFINYFLQSLFTELEVSVKSLIFPKCLVNVYVVKISRKISSYTPGTLVSNSIFKHIYSLNTFSYIENKFTSLGICLIVLILPSVGNK